MGDYNFDLLKAENHSGTSQYLELMYSHSFLPTICRPTRVTSRTATLIDNIYHNLPHSGHTHISGILYTDISDHFPIFYIYDEIQLEKKDEYVIIRKINPSTKAAFINRLEETDWSKLSTINDTQLAYDVFSEMFIKIYNDCFPKLTVKNTYRNRKPWLSQGLKDAIKKKRTNYISYQNVSPLFQNSVNIKNIETH